MHMYFQNWKSMFQFCITMNKTQESPQDEPMYPDLNNSTPPQTPPNAPVSEEERTSTLGDCVAPTLNVYPSLVIATIPAAITQGLFFALERMKSIELGRIVLRQLFDHPNRSIWDVMTIASHFEAIRREALSCSLYLGAGAGLMHLAWRFANERAAMPSMPAVGSLFDKRPRIMIAVPQLNVSLTQTYSLACAGAMAALCAKRNYDGAALFSLGGIMFGFLLVLYDIHAR